MKKIIIILTAIAIFLISLLRVAPIEYKGYPPSAVYENLILARNLALHNVYKIESDKNVILSSARVEKEGVPSSLGNKLTPILYGQIYKIFGLNERIPAYTSILLFILSNIILFFIILKLFNYWPAVIFSLFSIFMPVIWLGSVMPGFYEFAIFFFSFGLLTYFYVSRESKTLLVVASVFLSLAVLSRNAFIFSVLPLFFYDFYKTKSFKRLLIFIFPFLIIVGGFFAADFFKGGINSYLSKKPDSFLTYGHLFPDPYTYHFDRENFLKEVQKMSDPDISEFASKYGYRISLKNRLLMYLNSIIFYPKKLFSVTLFGGPILILLMVIGAVYLHKHNKDLFKYFIIFWLPFWYLALIFFKTNNWDHFLEVGFPLVLMLALGVWWIIGNVIAGNPAELRETKQSQGHLTRLPRSFQSLAVTTSIVFFVFLQVFSANKWMFHEMYESSHFEKYQEFIQKIKTAPLTDADVVAVDFSQATPLILNYYTDRNFVYFAPETIEKLKKENKIDEAFKGFGVTYFLDQDNFLNWTTKR